MKILLAIFSLLVFVGTASADSVWTYTGNTMTGCNCSLDGSVTLDSSGNATAWDFTDGTHDLTNFNSTGHILDTTSSNNPGAPAFTTWEVAITTSPAGLGDISQGVFLLSVFSGSAFEATDESFVNNAMFGFLEGNHGIWNQGIVATPEPATGLLVAGGLLCAGLVRRKRKKPLDSATWDKLA